MSRQKLNRHRFVVDIVTPMSEARANGVLTRAVDGHFYSRQCRVKSFRRFIAMKLDIIPELGIVITAKIKKVLLHIST